MEAYEKNLHISDEAFEGMRNNADRVLQRLIKNMIEKESFEGKLTINIDVSLTREFVMNTDPDIEGETRPTYTPKFSHKVGSVMQIKNETKGEKNYDGMELVWDEEKGEYVLVPIVNTYQRSIFDTDFRCVNDPEYEQAETPALEGRLVAALPAPVDDDGDEKCEEEEGNDADGCSEAKEDETDIPFRDNGEQEGEE